jgi:6-pyruvoyl-tetrahydropterin synthase
VSRWVLHSRAAFEARHALTSYRGAPEAPHSHRWQVAIRVGAEALNPDGYALDFHDVHALLAAAVAPLEGADLNHHPEIGRPSPTAERLAEVLAAHLTPQCAALGGTLLEVSVWEGEENRVDLHLEEDRRSNV